MAFCIFLMLKSTDGQLTEVLEINGLHPLGFYVLV